MAWHSWLAKSSPKPTISCRSCWLDLESMICLWLSTASTRLPHTWLQTNDLKRGLGTLVLQSRSRPLLTPLPSFSGLWLPSPPLEVSAFLLGYASLLSTSLSRLSLLLGTYTTSEGCMNEKQTAVIFAAAKRIQSFAVEVDSCPKGKGNFQWTNQSKLRTQKLICRVQMMGRSTIAAWKKYSQSTLLPALFRTKVEFQWYSCWVSDSQWHRLGFTFFKVISRWSFSSQKALSQSSTSKFSTSSLISAGTATFITKEPTLIGLRKKFSCSSSHSMTYSRDVFCAKDHGLCSTPTSLLTSLISSGYKRANALWCRRSHHRSRRQFLKKHSTLV